MLWIDTETYSETPIRRGTFVYAADAEVMLVSYAVDDGPVSVWDRTADGEMPADLLLALRDQSVPITAHNAQFDSNVMRLGRDVPIMMTVAGENVRRWRCTMVQALSHSLPPKLSALGAVLHLPPEMLKDEGAQLIHLFCKPLPVVSKLRRATRETHPEEWARFVTYAGQDIVAMRECARRMKRWNWTPADVELWHLDQIINRRGFAVDRELAEAAVAICGRAARKNANAVEMMTDGAVERATQRGRLLRHLLEEHGVTLPDMKATTLERRIDDPDLPQGVRDLLALRLAGNKNAVSKYNVLLRGVSADDRMRGTLQFRGAGRTGRDAGRLFQPQNLPRQKADPDEIAGWITLAKDDVTEIASVDDAQFASDALRGCIVAAPGTKLVQADYSNIEGRIVAWLADERWKLDAFAAFDRGEGPDLYNVTYARAFSVDVDTVTKGQRQEGKVIDLAGAYQGWVGAYQTFATLYRIEATDQQAARRMGAWRDAHPATRAFWPRLERNVRLAIAKPGGVFEVNDKITVVFRKPWLGIRLPSGRVLCYPHARLEGDEIWFKGQSQYSRGWSDQQTYGGKLTENITQAIAADLLWGAVAKAEANGYPVVLRVHDELLTEPRDEPRFSVAGLVALMTDTPPWAEGLPIAAAGFETHRYHK